MESDGELLPAFRVGAGQQSPAIQKGPRRRRRAALDDVTRLAGQHSSATAQTMCDQIAELVVAGLDRAVKLEPAMPKHLREEVYQWLALMPGLQGDPKKLRKEFERLLGQKVRRDLL